MAVYTEVSDEALATFLHGYELGAPVAFRGIAEGVENSNYTLRTTGGDYILTLFERRVDPAELPWFVGLMEHLAARGLPCPRPVRGADGAALRALCGRPAAITTFLPGMWPRRVTTAHCAPLGGSLARLHALALDYRPTRANTLGPHAWAPMLAAIGADAADTVRPGLAAELAAALPPILAGWPRGLPAGPIHADLFPDNLFFLDGAVSGVIDFLFAANDMWAYDLAICLNAWCFEPDFQFNATKARRLLEGYQAVRPLLPAERAALPVLCRGAAMRFLLTRLHDWLHTPAGALVTRKDPLEYHRKLRFHLDTKDPADYGA